MSSTTDFNRESVEEWLKPTLLKEKLTDYTISVCGTTEKGDGYLGDVAFVEVHGKSEENKAKDYDFVIKCGKRGKEFRKMMPVRMAFENEINFYTEILPQFFKFQKTKNIEQPFENVPKCYGTQLCEETEILVLENMKVKGYNLHDRMNCMNEEHIRKVLETYGKFHAISFALRDQNPELFHQLAEKLFDIMKTMMKNRKRNSKVTMFQHLIELAKEEKEEAIVEKCLHLDETVHDFHENAIDPNDLGNVIIHGDCWNNNFLFKYEDANKSKIADVCFLDFQLSKLASPVFDLSYFLFTTLSGETVGQFEDFINYYYECLSSSIRDLGSDPNQLYPFETFMKHWKKFSTYGLLLMPSIAKICLSEVEDVPDLVEAAEKGKDFGKVFCNEMKMKHLDKYRNRTLPIMKLAISKGFV